MTFAKFAFLAAGALGAAAFLIPAPDARAAGGNSGTLNGGGVAKGDISMQAGETDTIDVDLVEGSTVDVIFKSGFAANLAFGDPIGNVVDLGFTAGSKSLRTKSFPVTATGTFRFTISSADGSQGGYALTVKPKWAPKVPVSGVGQQVFDFTMPANGRIGAVISRAKSAPGQPRIVGLDGPGGNVVGTIEPVKNTVKLPATTAPTGGWYHLTVGTTDGTSGFQGTVTRTVPKVAPTKLNIVNGIDAISFKDSGIGDLFKRRCGTCHFWGNGYTGVKSYATQSLGRIRTGNMPPDGRFTNDQIALIQAWIGTGRQR